MSTPPTPPPRPPERPDGPPLRRTNDGGDQKNKHHFPWKVEPAPDGRGAPPPPKPPMLPRFARRIWPFLLLLFVLNYWIASTIPDHKSRIEVPYTVFKNNVRSGNVIAITSKGTAIQGVVRKAITYPTGKKARTSANFQTEQPAFADTGLERLLEQKNVTVNAKPLDSGRGTLSSILLSFGPTLLFILLLVFFMRRAAGGGGVGAGGIGGFGKSRAKRYEANNQRVSFADVAGIDDAEEELEEIVDFLKNPNRYRKLGGRIPRGVLLAGQPGTGKTLLARAVAGEAGVPFFSLSASEFIEMIVGVGASRVRDLFAQAKAAAPAIIFIDELDAIGRSRSSGGGFSGGHDEREQTLNQILTEMDGFDGSTGVIVLAATNRADVLDAALLRPGRFDRRVTVSPPDRVGRRQILAVHTRSMPLDPSVDLDAIASATPGMVGADLANLVNEAALTAARKDHDRVEFADFTEALEKIQLGTARKVVMTEADRRRTAFHEAGHAIVGMLTPGADPVRKVSIIPRGQALGVTFSAPDLDKFNYDEAYLLGRIRVALGGRVAEEIVFGDLTTGAESDIQQLTAIARRMVGRWGMSRAFGPIAVTRSESDGPLLPGASETSEHTQQSVDDEVQRIVSEQHVATTKLLTDHRSQLDSLAERLLVTETLDETDAYAAAGVERVPPPPSEEQPQAAGAAVARTRTEPT
jgi:cell division protease FtsH